VFFATLPQGSKKETAEDLLTQHRCCTSIPSADLCCDAVPVKLEGRSFALVGASRRKMIVGLSDTLRQLGVVAVRMEASPWALFRQSNATRSSKVTLKLLIDRGDLIGVLGQGHHPLLWRALTMSESAETSAEAIIS